MRRMSSIPRADEFAPPGAPVSARWAAAGARLVALARRAHLVLLGLAAALFFFLVLGPPVPKYNAAWGDYIVEETPLVIWGSSHFGQVANYALLQAGRLAYPDFDAHQALALASYLMGLVYLVAIAILALPLPRTRQVGFFIIASLSPITVFFHGDEELGAYPFPFLLLALGLHRIWKGEPGERDVAVSLLGGLGAALHGVGLFFLPGVIALRLAASRAGRSLRYRALISAEATATFFGVSGALVVLYIVAFKNVRFVPGDAGGAGQGTLLLPLLGSVPARGEFQAYSFFSLVHLWDIATILLLGAPAFCLFVLVALFQRQSAWSGVRSTWEQWILASLGLVITAWLYPAGGMLAAAFMLVPSVSLLQALSLLGFATAEDPRLWIRAFVPLLAGSSLATAVLWSKLVAGVF